MIATCPHGFTYGDGCRREDCQYIVDGVCRWMSETYAVRTVTTTTPLPQSPDQPPAK